MAIAKMKLINITGDENKLNDTLIKFIDFTDFHAIEASQFVDRVHGLKLQDAVSPCQSLKEELRQIQETYQLKLPELKVRKISNDINNMQQYVHDVHQTLENELVQIRQMEADINQYELALLQLKNIETLDISLDDLFSTKYVSVRFGKLPQDSLDKIKYYGNKPFVLRLFNQEEGHYWCMYMMANELEREVDNIFSSLFFERVRIPEFVHGTPEEAKKNIAQHLDKLQKELKERRKQLSCESDECESKLALINSEVNFLCKTYEARKYVVGVGSRFSITGFVEAKMVPELKQHYAGIEGLEVDARPANSDKRITPPTKLRNNWFARPFQMFVEMYGIPSHRDIDPTLFVAITYTLLFGIMFGDLGQGLVLAILGLVLSKWKKMAFGDIIFRLGISSSIFGLLYGSFFGNEEILTPFYTNLLGLAGKPIHIMDSNFTMNLLISTVLIGSVLILSAIITNIYVRFRNKEYGEAIFSSNGIFGFMFYGFILVGIVLNMLLGIQVFNIVTIILLLVIPVIGIFLKEPIVHMMEGHKPFPNGFGGFFVEGFFELFEVMLSYITNTMSFLRVGGFILSHAGMMLVVSTLMEMSGNNSWIVAIFGNIFVMGLEGLIVGIQVLRLEFYEMFSRYYESDGIEFKSIG